MRKTKKRLAVSLVSLLLCFCILLGTTWAWFTDEVSSAGNKIQAGNLKVDLELLDPKTGEWSSLKNSGAPIFNYDNWEPGYVYTRVLKIENEGSLALRWSAGFYSEKPLSILADVIDVYVLPSSTELAYPKDRSLEGYTCVGTLREFIDSIEETTHGVLAAEECAYLGIALKMREEAGNEYQSLSLGGAFDIRIYATQYTHESDSFDNIYDILADESIVAADSKTLSDGETAIKYSLASDGESIANVNVPADAVLDPTKPVTVVFDGIDPSTTIELGENTKAYAFDITVTNLKSDLAADQLITIVVAAPKGLPGLKAYHNGVLIPDAVYDEVAGTITFKTSSFSPFAFAYTEVEAGSLEELRAQVGRNERLIKLTSDLTIDLSKNGADRSSSHVLKSGSSTYYNAVNINSQNIAIDLNGHKITLSCGSAYNSNSDVGALFFVDVGGSLNIIDSVGTGYIKMANSVYAVWAPYADPSYVDIYNGIFIADSYAGDPLHLADTNTEDNKMPNENSCRALIYAGLGGKINVYGGYFLYNNTPSDKLDRNNGAFNCKDFYEGSRSLITIHSGVMLINNEYRQNPANTSTLHGSFDNYSIRLALGCKLSTEQVKKSLTVDGKTYDAWYQVCSYKVTYMHDTEVVGVEYVGDNTAAHSLMAVPEADHKWIDKEGANISSIPAGNTVDVVVYLVELNKYYAYFVDRDGNVIKAVPFTERDKKLPDGAEPKVPDIDGMIGHWESYSIDGVKDSIIVKPYYTADVNSGELATSTDLKALFQALSQGKTMIMTQDLGATQGNASQETACYITTSSSDKDAALNLNGYDLEYDFSNNSGKAWNIFHIYGGSSFTLSAGYSEKATLRMYAREIRKGTPEVFILDAGATLTLEKGVVVEFYYPTSATANMFTVAGMTQEQIIAQYPDLLFEETQVDGQNLIRLTVLETVTIVAPSASN